MSQITIQSLESEYPEFKRQVETKIKSFNEHKSYYTFTQDFNGEAWVSRDYIQKNLDKIENAYAFVKLLKDIYNLKFPQMIIDFAGQHRFKPRNLVKEINYEAMLAIDLVLHYPLWNCETCNNHDFIGMGFYRPQPLPNIKLTWVAFVPILNIRVDERGELSEIKSRDWQEIRHSLGEIT